MNFDFPQTLILILVGLLFFKENILSWIGEKLGFAKTQPEMTPEWASKLQQYFNHDTTDYHTKSHEKLDRLIQMEEKEHESNDKMRETLVGINNTLANIDKYGVNCRK